MESCVQSLDRQRWALGWALVLVVLALVNAGWAADTDADTPSYKLLLTAQRIKRLRRDRERATPRWANFEKRVLTVQDSPERGFELALYSAVTDDKKTAIQAVEWAKAHPSERRQISLILDWLRRVLPDQDASVLTGLLQQPEHTRGPDVVAKRDEVFAALASDKNIPPQNGPAWTAMLDQFKGSALHAETVYALCEYLDTVRRATHEDLRSEDTDFFSDLPAELLLASKPKELEASGWQMRAAALALVSLDPNLVNSQFLQGWAMEDQQLVRDGPGVAYEFLWGNPYLPGVSYQNLDPWLYDSSARLFARSDWNPNACWISITPGGIQEQDCPSDWRKAPTQFGRLLLVPANGDCLEIRPDPTRTAIVWGFEPGQKIQFHNYEKKEAGQADRAGMFRLPFSASGKVCPRGQ